MAGLKSRSLRGLDLISFTLADFPLAFLTALALGYLLSGFLLRPIESIIKKSNEISLQGQIYLL